MAVTALALGAILLGAVAVVMLGRERDAARRVARVAARLDGRAPSQGGITAGLDELDRAVESTAFRLADAVSSEHLVRALDAIPQGVVICDGGGTVVFENGVGAAYSQARHGEALVSAAVSEQLSAAVGGVHASTSIELFGPPRRALQIDAYPLPPASDGSPTGGLAVIEDVSERLRLDLVRRDFVANISHELKTPVGALALLAETLVAADDPEDIERLSLRMLDEAHRVGRTIDDLLALSSIEGDQGIDRRRRRVSDLVAEAVSRGSSAAEQRGITVEVDVPRDLFVRGDARQLVSALFNLLDNAVKYSDAGLSVAVVAHRQGEWVDCTITDHGPGIPPRDHERIFERFYRVDRARSRETGGTGLGLAIVRHVATNHGGEVTVSSREGEGAAFTLHLPVADSYDDTDPDTESTDHQEPSRR